MQALQNYLESLRWYDGELQRDPYVVGAAIFAARWNVGDGTFDIADQPAIRDYIGQPGPAPLPPLPAPIPNVGPNVPPTFHPNPARYRPGASLLASPFAGGFRVTQTFGNDPAYYQPFGFLGHEGVDLVPRAGDGTVRAVEGGEVVRDYDTPRNNYGILVVTWNRETHRGWWYGHLASNAVTPGQRVAAGQVLGVMGATGQSRGAHLHLGLRLTDDRGYAVNPGNGYKGFIDGLPLLDAK